MLSSEIEKKWIVWSEWEECQASLFSIRDDDGWELGRKSVLLGSRGAILSPDAKGQQACTWRVLDSARRPAAFLHPLTNHYTCSPGFSAPRTRRNSWINGVWTWASNAARNSKQVGNPAAKVMVLGVWHWRGWGPEGRAPGMGLSALLIDLESCQPPPPCEDTVWGLGPGSGLSPDSRSSDSESWDFPASQTVQGAV